MNKLVLSLCVFLLSVLPGMASHIVGGELELVQKRGPVHQIILKMYVDEYNATSGVIQGEVDALVGIYSKATNTEITRVRLPRRQSLPVSYGENCSSTSFSIKTGLLVFYEDVNLNGFNDPAGYYISWIACCRNGVIKNILNPDDTGMVFYLEFPPVSERNSSPRFPHFSGDFPCLNRPFSLDFGGIDPNGDSLVYRRATPLAGDITAATSFRNQVEPGPYPTVDWKTSMGYNVNNQIPGTPAFDVHPQTGEITFTANQTGLFVFSVEVDEYRNGVKIGMVKRDFQLQVVSCPPNAPTSIDLKLPDGSSYSSTDTLEIRIEQDTCFTFLVSDSNTIKYNQSENLKVAIKSNLPPGVLTITPNITVSPNGSDTASAVLCFDACNKLFLETDSVFTIEITSTDAPKCPKSLATYDTVRVKVLYKPQPNVKPAIGSVPALATFNATSGILTEFDIFGTDADINDIITLSAAGAGFSMAEKGMSFNNVSGSDSIASRFRWAPTCEDIENSPYVVQFFIKDNSCVKHNVEPLTIYINVEDKTTTIPFISPSNLFTPNGDKLNDYFEIPNMPEGNCDYFFRKISIFNRWGAKVYENNSPGFQWSGEKQPSGLYFYTIDLNKKLIKGWVELIR